MTPRCARCTWAPDPADPARPAEQARQHALDWQHPMCSVCAHSLDTAHPQTCETCISTAQELLAGVHTMWTELPRELGHAKAAPLDRDGRGGSDEHALPGGTVFALLAPGSVGDQPSRRGNTEHLQDNAGSTVPSVAWTLASWESDWRDTRGDEPAPTDRRTAAVVRDAARYLEVHTRWAANSHEAFGEYVDEMRELHGRLEVALGRVRRPVKAGASCFSCGGALERPVSASGLEVTTRDEHGNEVPHIVCRDCGTQYGPQHYAMALKAAAAAASRFSDGTEEWATPQVLATDDLRQSTLRSWKQRGQIRGILRAGVLFVSVNDVQARQAERVAWAVGS